MFEEVADGFDFAMGDGKGGDSGLAEVEGAVDGFWEGFEVAAVAVFAIEGVFEHAFENGEGGGGAVDGDELVEFGGEAAEFVKARDVIHVGVSEEGGFEVADASAEALLAEVGTGVDDPIQIGSTHPDGGAEAIVPGVGGATGFAVATDGGNADGSAGAEKGERKGGHEIRRTA